MAVIRRCAEMRIIAFITDGADGAPDPRTEGD
jgi:hypothetical protein